MDTHADFVLCFAMSNQVNNLVTRGGRRGQTNSQLKFSTTSEVLAARAALSRNVGATKDAPHRIARFMSVGTGKPCILYYDTAYQNWAFRLGCQNFCIVCTTAIPQYFYCIASSAMSRSYVPCKGHPALWQTPPTEVLDCPLRCCEVLFSHCLVLLGAPFPQPSCEGSGGDKQASDFSKFYDLSTLSLQHTMYT